MFDYIVPPAKDSSRSPKGSQESEDGFEPCTSEISDTTTPSLSKTCIGRKLAFAIVIGLMSTSIIIIALIVHDITQRNSSSNSFPSTPTTESPSIPRPRIPSSPTKAPATYPSNVPSHTPTINLPISSSSPLSVLPTHQPTQTLTSIPSHSPIRPTPQPTQSPTSIPSHFPTSFSSDSPTSYPSDFPSIPPTNGQTGTRTSWPSSIPTTPFSVTHPSDYPSISPSTTRPKSLVPTTTIMPTAHPSPSTPPERTFLTYVPGDLTVNQTGLLLSTGLEATLIATSGHPVIYANGSFSKTPFHVRPDFGAVFSQTNDGEWIYVSNSDASNANEGGVGALTFDEHGQVMDYKMVLANTTMNHGGGATPWGTWVTSDDAPSGQNWQVDPAGERDAEVVEWTEDFNSFACQTSTGYCFVAEDHQFGLGPLRRWVPDEFDMMDMTDPWSILHSSGKTAYLYLIPGDSSGGMYDWIEDAELAANNAIYFYRNAKGIYVSGSKLYFSSHDLEKLFILDLDHMNYTIEETQQEYFDGRPNQLARVMGGSKTEELLYFSSKAAGVHARNHQNQYVTILERDTVSNDDKNVDEEETTGLAFSPNYRYMYVAYKKAGKLFAISRRDGMSFDEKSLDIKYHSSDNRL